MDSCDDMSSGADINKANTRQHNNKKENIRTLHMCILVHGWKGLRADFNYMESTLREKSSLYMEQKSSNFVNEEFIIYNCKSNENNTDDGIILGGERVANETLEFLKEKINEYKEVEDVTLSFVGASLGGLYARYAIAIIQENLIQAKEESMPYFMMSKNIAGLEQNIGIYFNCFFAVVSPFLGLVRNSFIPLPRIVQSGLCRALGSTLDDVFNFTDLIHDLCTSSSFLNSLASFHKRIAFVNTYSTDLSVPTETSAFIHKKSHHPHHFISEGFKKVDDIDPTFIVAKVKTEKTREFNPTIGNQPYNRKSGSNIDYYDDDIMVNMCENLDALGWTKIFIDTRSAIRLGVNLNFASNITHQLQKFLADTSFPCTTLDLQKKLKDEEVVESRDLANILSSPFSPSNFILSVPMGHKTIGACNRNAQDEFMFRGGQTIATNMVETWVADIFSWKAEHR